MTFAGFHLRVHTYVLLHSVAERIDLYEPAYYTVTFNNIHISTLSQLCHCHCGEGKQRDAHFFQRITISPVSLFVCCLVVQREQMSLQPTFSKLRNSNQNNSDRAINLSQVKDPLSSWWQSRDPLPHREYKLVLPIKWSLQYYLSYSIVFGLIWCKNVPCLLLDNNFF